MSESSKLLPFELLFSRFSSNDERAVAGCEDEAEDEEEGVESALDEKEDGNRDGASCGADERESCAKELSKNEDELLG